MKKLWLSCLISLLGFAFPISTYCDEDIVVQLSLSQPKVPIYVGPFQGAPTFNPHYLDQLFNVLIYDLDNTSKIETTYRQAKLEILFEQGDFKKIFANDTWRSDRIKYVLLPRLDQDILSLMVYHVEYNHIQHYKNITLSGDLNLDRRQIHKLADSLHQYLFHKPGIANTKILYTLQTPSTQNQERRFHSEIWQCDYDGHNTKKLTSSEKYCITPIFFPAKAGQIPSQFLYVSYEKGPSKIFMASLDNPDPSALIDLKGNQLLPALSRDRSKIAFISDAGGRADLFLQAIHPERGLIGKPIQVYSFPSSVQASPTFNPTATKLAFVSDKEGTPRIYLIETPHVSKPLKLPQAQCITLKNRENTCPNWSPDGRKLAYSAKTEGIRQIWIYDFETQEEKQLTTGSEHKENPCWAPDSQHLIFNTAGNTCELFIIDLLQPTMLKISNGAGKKHYPAWQP